MGELDDLAAQLSATPTSPTVGGELDTLAASLLAEPRTFTADDLVTPEAAGRLIGGGPERRSDWSVPTPTKLVGQVAGRGASDLWKLANAPTDIPSPGSEALFKDSGATPEDIANWQGKSSIMSLLTNNMLSRGVGMNIPPATEGARSGGMFPTAGEAVMDQTGSPVAGGLTEGALAVVNPLAALGMGEAFGVGKAVASLPGESEFALTNILRETMGKAPLDAQRIAAQDVVGSVRRGLEPAALAKEAQAKAVAAEAAADRPVIEEALQTLRRRKELSETRTAPDGKTYSFIQKGAKEVKIPETLTAEEARKVLNEDLATVGRKVPDQLLADTAPRIPSEPERILERIQNPPPISKPVDVSGSQFPTPEETAPYAPPGMKERRFAQTVRNADDTPPLIRAQTLSDPQLYSVMSHADTLKAAEALTPQERASRLFETSGPMDRVTAAGGILHMQDAFKAGDMAGGTKAMETLAQRFTENGQGIEIVKAFYDVQRNPSAFAFWADKAFQRTRDGLVKEFVAKHPTLEGISEKGIRDLAEGAKGTPEVLAARKFVGKLDQYKVPEKQMVDWLRRNEEIVKMDDNLYKVAESAKLMDDIHRAASRKGLLGANYDKILGYVDAIHVLGMLGNVKTPLRNVIGNTVMWGAEQTKSYMAAGIDWARSMATGGERQRFAPLGLAPQLKAGMRQARQEAAYIKAGVDPAQTDIMKYAGKEHTRFESAWNPYYWFQKFADYTLRTPDQFAYGMAKEKSLYNSAMSLAWSEGVRGKELSKRVAEVMANPTASMIGRANVDGLYATFRDESAMAKFFTGMHVGLNKITTGSNRFGLGSMLLRFPRTPANIIKAIEEYSPFGALNSLYHILSKTSSAGQAEDAIARTVIGSSLGYLGWKWEAAGVLRGSRNPKQPALNAYDQALGRNNQSVNVTAVKRYSATGNLDDLRERANDTWVDVGNVLPLGQSLIMGANGHHNWTKDTSRGEKVVDVLGAIPLQLAESVGAAVNTLGEQPLWSAMSRFLGKDPSASLGDVLEALPASMVPSIISQIQQIENNRRLLTKSEQRDVQASAKLLARVPILSAALQGKYNALGLEDERMTAGGKNSALNVIFNPFAMSKVLDTPETDLYLKIAKHAYDFNSTAGLPPIPSDALKAAGVQHDLTPEEWNNFRRDLGARYTERMAEMNRDQRYKDPPVSEELKDAYRWEMVSRYSAAATKEITNRSIDETIKRHEAVKINKSLYKQLPVKATYQR